MTNKLRFALVGCGRIAQRYSDIFASDHLANGQLVAACDLVPVRAEKLAKRHGIPVYSDFRRMMDERHGEIDVVCVLTESGRHAQHAAELASVLPDKYSPIRASGDSNPGVYLAQVPETMGALLLRLLAGQVERIQTDIGWQAGPEWADGAAET